jgi:hypothetical protein
LVAAALKHLIEVSSAGNNNAADPGSNTAIGIPEANTQELQQVLASVKNAVVDSGNYVRKFDLQGSERNYEEHWSQVFEYKDNLITLKQSCVRTHANESHNQPASDTTKWDCSVLTEDILPEQIRILGPLYANQYLSDYDIKADAPWWTVVIYCNNLIEKFASNEEYQTSDALRIAVSSREGADEIAKLFHRAAALSIEN